MPARWLSQHAWWSLMWPVLGTSAVAHAWARILLHAGAALAVALIARRAGLSVLQQILAGTAFAATPIAFTPLYWASGIQELLSGILTLLAIERWFAGGNRSVVAAGILGSAALLAKESPLGLPLFLGGWILAARRGPRPPRARAWIVPAVLAVVAIGEAMLVSQHFVTSPNARYATGGALVSLGNLGKFGWWLATPGPVFTAQVDWTRAIVGLALWAIWGAAGWVRWRRGSRLVLASWFGALLTLAPALPLVHQANPYLGYLAAAAVVLTMAGMLPQRLGARPTATAAMVVIGAVLWGQLNMRGRIGAVDADGRPADPVVRAMAASRRAADALLSALPPDFDPRLTEVVIYQPELRESTASTPVHAPQEIALGGSIGLCIALGRHGRAAWVKSLLAVPDGAQVLSIKGEGFQDWGKTRDAVIHAATLHLAAGQYAKVHALLVRAAELGPLLPLRASGPDVLGISAHLLSPRVSEFERWVRVQEAEGTISADDASLCRRFRPGS